jgi:transcriptional regulator GlxA family with amidase domain
MARVPCQLEQCEVVLEVTKYFSSNYSSAIHIPEMADKIQIPLEEIEYAFDAYKRKTAAQALLNYRLNRLCDRMSENPSEEINEQMTRCGLVDFQSTSTAFESCFGIDIVEYHKQCFLAAASKIAKSQNKEIAEEELIDDATKTTLKQTRFHQRKH